MTTILHRSIDNQVDSDLLINQQETKYQVAEKGFSLYNWISFSELRQTVMIDYLSILSMISIPFSIIFIVTGVINFYMFQESNIISYGLLYVLLGGYALVFIGMIFKMIYRSWIFFKVNNVFFTDTHIGVAGKVTSLDEYDTIRSDVDRYGELFHEKLGGKSTTLNKMQQLKEQVFGGKSKTRELVDDIGTDSFSGLGKEAGVFILVIAALVFLYWVSLYIFYFLGFLISWILSYIFVGIVMLLKSIFVSKEERINKTLLKMNIACEKIKQDQLQATGYITQNINGDYTNKNKVLVDSLDNTLKSVTTGLNLSKQLYTQLLDSKYNNAFNFTTFHNWVNSQITEPTQKMLELLILSNEKIDSQITLLQRKLVDLKDEQQVASYELQLVRLKSVRENINNQIVVWTQMLETLQSQVFKKLHQ